MRSDDARCDAGDSSSVRGDWPCAGGFLARSVASSRCLESRWAASGDYPLALVLTGKVACDTGSARLLAAIGWLWRRFNGAAALARAVTWDCGYVGPTARMQYTAGSFAGLITEWFSWILRPERHERRPEVLLPASAGFEQSTPQRRCSNELSSRQPWWSCASQQRCGISSAAGFNLTCSYLLIGLAGLAAMAIFGGGE